MISVAWKLSDYYMNINRTALPSGCNLRLIITDVAGRLFFALS